MNIEMHIDADFDDLVASAKGLLQALTKDVLVQIGEALVAESPVGDVSMWKRPAPAGYLPGKFIDNWQVGRDGDIPELELNTKDPSGANSLARLKKLGRWQIGHEYVFVNNVDYAERIEQGWSSQAPVGVISLVEMRISEFCDKAYDRVLPAYQQNQLDKQFERGNP